VGNRLGASSQPNRRWFSSTYSQAHMVSPEGDIRDRVLVEIAQVIDGVDARRPAGGEEPPGGPSNRSPTRTASGPNVPSLAGLSASLGQFGDFVGCQAVDAPAGEVVLVDRPRVAVGVRQPDHRQSGLRQQPADGVFVADQMQAALVVAERDRTGGCGRCRSAWWARFG